MKKKIKIKNRTPAMNSLKFKLTIAYDGTAYQGWQVQQTGVRFLILIFFLITIPPGGLRVRLRSRLGGKHHGTSESK